MTTPNEVRAAAESIVFTIEGKLPFKFAQDWYTPAQIHRAINRGGDLSVTVPSNVNSIEFAEWMAHQYALAMHKGMDIVRRSHVEPATTALAAATARVKELEGENARLRSEFDPEDDEDKVPEYGSDAYLVFNRGIDFSLKQLAAVLDVKEYFTSGGGTETLDGDLRSEIYDILKAAHRDDDSIGVPRRRRRELRQ